MIDNNENNNNKDNNNSDGNSPLGGGNFLLKEEGGAAYRLLLIEDSPEDAFLVKRSVRNVLGDNVAFVEATSMGKAKECVAAMEGAFDAVLLDLELPDTMDGADSLEQLASMNLHVPVVLVTGSHKKAMKLIERSAADYVNKRMLLEHPQLIRNAIDYAIARHARARGQQVME